MLAPDEIDALEKAAMPAKTESRAIAFTLGRGDHDITRGLAVLDMLVPMLRHRVRDRLRHQTQQAVDVDDTAPVARPIEELFSRNPHAVIVEVGGGIGLPPGYFVLGDTAARAMALAALQVRSCDVVNDGERGSSITPGELRLLTRLVGILIDDIAGILPASAPGQPLRLLRMLTDARALGPTQGILLCLSFTLTGDIDARIDLGIPSSWLVRAPRAPEKKGPSRRIGDDLSTVMLSVSAELGRTPTTLRRLLALVPGDVIYLLASPSSPVPVLVQGKPKLLARPELRGGRVSLNITAGPGDAHEGMDNSGDDPTSAEGTPIVDAAPRRRQK